MRRPGALVRLVLVAALAGTAGLASSPSRAADPFGSCEQDGAQVRVGVVACRTLPSPALGGTTAFSYYVPPACAPTQGGRCPTLYLLHGFSGDLRSMLGDGARPSAWVAALTRRPAVSPYASAQPWVHADPAQWVPAAPLDVVLVAPDGRTVPGGFGPAPWLEGFWADWNPRYARGGDSERYPTPAPRFAAALTDELVPYVEAHLPVGSGREWRALAGTSLGGYGAYAIGLTHPDLFADLGSVSGIMNFLLAPGIDPSPDGGPGGVAAPVAVPYAPLPGPAGASAPLAQAPDQARGYAVATYAFGDPVADQAYYRGRMPVDLALNAHASRRGTPSVVLRGFWNDAVPRQQSDVADPPGYLGAQAFEGLVRLSNVEQSRAFGDAGVTRHEEQHPGIHSGPYWNPWLRTQLEAQYAGMRHADGSGDPAPVPTVFDYRTTEREVAVWGWRLHVQRPTTEFLQLTEVTCAGLALRGTGVVTVTPPRRCGVDPVVVDLGPPAPTDAPAGADAAPVYGRSVRVTLHRRAGR